MHLSTVLGFLLVDLAAFVTAQTYTSSFTVYGSGMFPQSTLFCVPSYMTGRHQLTFPSLRIPQLQLPEEHSLRLLHLPRLLRRRLTEPLRRRSWPGRQRRVPDVLLSHCEPLRERHLLPGQQPEQHPGHGGQPVPSQLCPLLQRVQMRDWWWIVQ